MNDKERIAELETALRAVLDAHRPVENYRSRGYVGGWRKSACWCGACLQATNALLLLEKVQP